MNSGIKQFCPAKFVLLLYSKIECLTVLIVANKRGRRRKNCEETVQSSTAEEGFGNSWNYCNAHSSIRGKKISLAAHKSARN